MTKISANSTPSSEATVVKWLHSPSGRSKRSASVAHGCFVLEHDATGRFFIGQSDKVSAEVDKHLLALASGKHPSKLLNELYNKDSAIRVYEHPCKSKPTRTRLLRALVDEQANDYLCLNPIDHPSLSRR